MKSRVTALLATVLALAACVGVPVARVSSARATCAIVCEWRERRVEQQPAQTRRTASPKRPVEAAIAPPEFACQRLLVFSLFQRPPPSSIPAA